MSCCGNLCNLRVAIILLIAPVALNAQTFAPTPASDAQALSFTKEKIDEAGKLTGRRFRISDETILRHYRNRGIMPFEIAPNLNQQEYEKIKGELPPGMMVRPIYVRVYPNGKLAGQIIGYTGKTGRNPDGIVDNHETILSIQTTATFSRWRPGLLTTPMCLFPRSQLINTRRCKRTPTFHFCRERIVRLIRQARHLRSRSASPRSKAAQSVRMTNLTASRRDCREWRHILSNPARPAGADIR